jgi:hypothetical protein
MAQLHLHIKPELVANHTRTLRGPHLTALIEDWLMRKQDGAATSNPDSAQRPAA